MIRAAGIVLCSILCSFSPENSRAQFSRPVVILSGTIHRDPNHPVLVRVSVRERSDTTREVVASTCNRETGKYLVILQPGKEYYLHLQGESIQPADILIVTPNAQNKTIQMNRDLEVVYRDPLLFARQ